MATTRPMASSSAEYTMPIAPRPMDLRIRYRPILSGSPLRGRAGSPWSLMLDSLVMDDQSRHVILGFPLECCGDDGLGLNLGIGIRRHHRLHRLEVDHIV